MSESFARYGLDISPHEVGALFTGGTMKSAGEEAKKRGAQLPDTWVSDMNSAVAALLKQGVPVFDGLFDLLDTLDKQGIQTAVASNGPMSKMQASLTPSGLWNRFAGRIYSGHEHAPKPKQSLSMTLQPGAKPDKKQGSKPMDSTQQGTHATLPKPVQPRSDPCAKSRRYSPDQLLLLNKNMPAGGAKPN